MTPAGEGRPNQPSVAEFPVDFADFVHALNANGVEYLLVGGYAVGVHGYVRATVDIDFFFRRTPENVGERARDVSADHASQAGRRRFESGRPLCSKRQRRSPSGGRRLTFPPPPTPTRPAPTHRTVRPDAPSAASSTAPNAG